MGGGFREWRDEEGRHRVKENRREVDSEIMLHDALSPLLARCWSVCIHLPIDAKKDLKLFGPKLDYKTVKK